MHKLLTLLVLIVVGAVLWWALTQILAVMTLPPVVETLATVAFVVILVLAVADYLLHGTWFWDRH